MIAACVFAPKWPSRATGPASDRAELVIESTFAIPWMALTQLPVPP